MHLQGKTALVTGGAKRVGRAIAIDLARQGVNLILHHHSSIKEAEEAAKEIRNLGVSCILDRADLSKTSEIQSMISKLTKDGAVPDILVNSASLYYRTPHDKLNEKSWDELVDVNLKAPYLLSVELAKKMAAGKGGKIINIADWSGFRPYKDYLPYCTSKGGLITLTKAIARDFAPKVYANAVAPGPVLSPQDMPDTEKAAIAKTTALGRWGKPEDVACAVRFLLENDFINGTILVVDGGRSIV